MNVARQFLEVISEVSQRRKSQLEDQLKIFKQKVKTATGANKKTFASAITGTELSLKGRAVPNDLTKAIFRALEL